MSELIERMARAIHDRTLDDDQLADCGLPMEDAVECARAALKAMREPTEKMIIAASIISTNMVNEDIDNKAIDKAVWQAMIDAELNDA